MESKIRVLSDQTINKIAAGEVVENTASIVKELIENALDARASEIKIEVVAGGRQLIRVSDDGCGMGPDDAVLSLERHATSKISKLEDMMLLDTMGFRGEALPSISSVSRMKITTCNDRKTFAGTEVDCHAGKIVAVKPCRKKQGTSIEVKSLFFNVPVRKEFQKSVGYDSQEIYKMVGLLALSNPCINFKLISDGKEELNFKTAGDLSLMENLKIRIEHFLGKSFASDLVEVNYEKEGKKIEGFVGLPSYLRANRLGQYLFINLRVVTSLEISFAVKDGYGTRIDPRKFPVFVLHLSLNKQDVDVNVHPQKKELRFKNAVEIKKFVCKSIDIAFQGKPASKFENSETNSILPYPVNPVFSLQNSYLKSHPSFSSNKTESDPKVFEQTQMIIESEPHVLAQVGSYTLINFNSVSQLIGNVDIAETDTCIVIFDQLAAQSRILYEKYLRAYSLRGTLNMQTLLLPKTLEFSKLEMKVLDRYLEDLNKMGISLRLLGDTTYILDAVPCDVQTCDFKGIVRDIVENLCTRGEKDLDKEKFIAKILCKVIANKNRRASLEQAKELFKELMKCQSPYYSVEGRKTIAIMNEEDFAKKFKPSY